MYLFQVLGHHIREDEMAILIVFDRLIGIKYRGGKDWVNLRKRIGKETEDEEDNKVREREKKDRGLYVRDRVLFRQ